MPKRDEITDLIQTSECDIVMLTETWLSPAIIDSEIFPTLPNFLVYRHDRLLQRGGGVLIGVNRSVRHSKIEINCPLEALWISCESPRGTTIFGVCYRPPKPDNDFPTHLNDALDLLHKKFPKGSFILVGDFNYPNINWRDNCAIYPHSECNEFLNCLENYQLTQVITQATRETATTSNILDLILLSDPSSLQSVLYLQELSDHKVILATFTTHLTVEKSRNKQIKLYDRGNYEAINTALDEFYHSFKEGFDNRSVQENWHLFASKITELSETFIPTITIKEKPSAPWFTKTIKRMIGKKKRLFKTARKKNRKSAREAYHKAEIQLKKPSALPNISFFA